MYVYKHIVNLCLMSFSSFRFLRPVLTPLQVPLSTNEDRKPYDIYQAMTEKKNQKNTVLIYLNNIVHIIL